MRSTCQESTQYDRWIRNNISSKTTTIRQCINKTQSAWICWIEITLLPGKRKTKHTHNLTVNKLYLYKKRDKHEATIPHRRVDEEIKVYQAIYVSLLLLSAPILSWLEYLVFYVVQIARFVNKVSRTKNSLPKNYMYNGTPPVYLIFLSRLLVATTTARLANNRCFSFLVSSICFPLYVYLFSFTLILVQFFLIFLLILVVLTELIYANYIIIWIRLVSSVEQMQMRTSNQDGRRIGCSDLN